MTSGEEVPEWASEAAKEMDAEFQRIASAALPTIRNALQGTFAPKATVPHAEAWIALALFGEGALVPLVHLVKRATLIERVYPSADEIAGGVWHLAKRGWLIVRGDDYGLAPEGRHTVARVIEGARGEGEQLMRLHAWMQQHPQRSIEGGSS